MKVIFTAPALEDLRDIRAHLQSNYPSASAGFERVLRAALQRVSLWPQSAYTVEARAEVRAVPLRRYPYRIYYTITARGAEILHIHHDKRQPWPMGSE